MMAWMIVKTGATYRRPRSKYSFTFDASPEPQQFPNDAVEYAVSKGLAEKVRAPRRKAAEARESENRA
jgi:hypothetical protein